MIKLTLTTTRNFQSREEIVEYVAVLRKEDTGFDQLFFRDLLHRGKAEQITKNANGDEVLTVAEIDEVQ